MGWNKEGVKMRQVSWETKRERRALARVGLWCDVRSVENWMTGQDGSDHCLAAHRGEEMEAKSLGYISQRNRDSW